ncbi:MAG: dethiobiotin synthase [Rhodospirillales bacterium]
MIRRLIAEGRPARAIKPVISGWDGDDADAIAQSDTGQLLAAQGIDATDEAIDACSPYRFKAPLSPDMAAAREGLGIDFDRLVGFCRQELENTGDDETLFIEGVGGVMVPLTDHHTVLDWIAALDIPVVLVVGSYLGTISHTLTAVMAMRTKHIALRTIVISESEESPVPCEETAETIKRHLGAATIEIVARNTEIELVL